MEYSYDGSGTPYAFIFPVGEDAAGQIQQTYYIPEELGNITILSQDSKTGYTVYYDLSGVDEVDRVCSDKYTMFIRKTDGTLWFWDSDRIKYHDNVLALTNPEDGTENCAGQFVEADIQSIFGTDDDDSMPYIVDMQSGMENAIFLTNDGSVFYSWYKTCQVDDVEYFRRNNPKPGELSSVLTIEDMELKQLVFEKMDLQNIAEIYSDGADMFYAVDLENIYYRIKIEEGVCTYIKLNELEENGEADPAAVEQPDGCDMEEDWLVYDSLSVFHINFYEKVPLPYADEETYEILREAYEEVDFLGEFKKGDPDVYDEYKSVFLKLLKNEIPFLDEETGEEIYLEDFGRLGYTFEEDKEVYQYYFFDVDEDGMPELGIGDVTLQYIYKYDSGTGKCILWYSRGGWEQWLGSRKLANPLDGQYMYFCQFGQDGKVECETDCFAIWYTKEESLYMAMMPEYADAEKETEVTDQMKAQGVYVRSSGQWYFRITEEQYTELNEAYGDACDMAKKKIEEVTYTYEELFGE